MNAPPPKTTSKIGLEALTAALTPLKTVLDLIPAWLQILSWTLVVTIAPTLMVNGYLRTYGQPGLGAFGDNLIIGLAQSAGLFMVLFTGLIGFILAAPLLTRRFFAHAQAGLGLADHINTPMLGAAREAWPGQGKAHPSWAYFTSNLSLLGLAALQVCQQQYPILRQDWLIWPLLALSPIACVILVQATLRRDEQATGARFMAAILGLMFALSSWSWVSSVATALEPSLPPPATKAWAYWAMVMGAACVVHWALSAASHYRNTGLILSGFVVVAALWFAPGYKLLVFNALRAGNAGGAAPIYYPDPARRTLGGPMKTACLILSAGEYRIVRLTDDPQACGNGRARKFFGELMRMDPETDRRTKLCGVMPIRREAFAGALALAPENTKGVPAPSPVTNLGCAKDNDETP